MLFLPAIKNFTPSHVAALCLAIEENIEFLTKKQLKKSHLLDLFQRTTKDITLPLANMQARMKSMKDWHDRLMNRSTPMGFTR